jgi:hypothetical protein
MWSRQCSPRNAAVPLTFFLQKVANVLPGLISGWKLKAYRYSYHDLKFPEITVAFSR